MSTGIRDGTGVYNTSLIYITASSALGGYTGSVVLENISINDNYTTILVPDENDEPAAAYRYKKALANGTATAITPNSASVVQPMAKGSTFMYALSGSAQSKCIVTGCGTTYALGTYAKSNITFEEVLNP